MSGYDYYKEFLNKFHINNIRLVVNPKSFDYGPGKTASYYANQDEVVEMEIPRYGFEELVKLDQEYDVMCNREYDELRLRKHYPAVQEAYDKYQMLLALYK